jgi:hypothetical protein
MVQDYPKKTVSNVLSVSRSTLYYQPQPVDDERLRAAIRDVAGQFPTYGYRRVTAELGRRKLKANRKRVGDGFGGQTQAENAANDQQCPQLPTLRQLGARPLDCAA